MSDTVRTYSQSRSSNLPARRRRGHGCAAVPLALLLPLLIVLGLYIVWITRDSQPIERHLPRDYALHIELSDILGRRHEIAAAGIWHALPPSEAIPDIPALLASDLDLPPWVLNNILGSTCFISAPSLANANEFLFATKMHRVGVVIERVFRQFGEAQFDRAGGLHLRYLPTANFYYAVRGRALLVSPSRQTLIHALTLSPGDALAEHDLDLLALGLANQQVGGFIRFSDRDAVGDKIAELRFGVRFAPTESHARLEATLAQPWDDNLAPLLTGLAPTTLRAPMDGMLVISADFAQPIEQLWTGFGRAFDNPLFSKAQWEQWATVSGDEPPALAYTLTQLLGPAGPGFQLTWHGLDPYEILPMPHIILTARMPQANADQVLAAFPDPPADLPLYATFPRIDPQTRLVTLPMFGGPSIEPTAGFVRDTLVLSNSSILAQQVLAQPPPLEPLPLPGNLYFRIRPGECVDAIAEAGQQLVDIHALKGHTPESYRDTIAAWKQGVHDIEECSGLLSYQDGRLQAELRLVSRNGSR
jgi:hypothetical protein